MSIRGFFEDIFGEDLVEGVGDLFDYFTDDSQGQILGSVLGSIILNQSGLLDPKIPQVGYQGGIPEYQAMRRQVPLAIGKEYEDEQGQRYINPMGSGLGSISEGYNRIGNQVNLMYDPNRRPGSGGRRYFTDMQYASTGRDMGSDDPVDPQAINATIQEQERQARDLRDLNVSNLAREQRSGSPVAPIPRQPYYPTPRGPISATVPFENNPIIPVDEITLPIGSTTPIQPAVDEITLPNRDLPFDPRDRFRDSGIPRILQERLQRARPRFGFEEGGIAKLAKGRYLDGDTDGMADEVPATINGKQPAALSDGEFVIPADVVSHLGNGNSDAGAKILEQMMARVRKERTGNKEQGKEINARNMLPA